MSKMAGLVQVHKSTLKGYTEAARSASRLQYLHEVEERRRAAAEREKKHWLVRWWYEPATDEGWWSKVALETREARLNVLEAAVADNVMVFLTLEEFAWLKSWAK